MAAVIVFQLLRHNGICGTRSTSFHPCHVLIVLHSHLSVSTCIHTFDAWQFWKTKQGIQNKYLEGPLSSIADSGLRRRGERSDADLALNSYSFNGSYLMRLTRMQRIIDWLVGLFFIGSLLSSVGLYLLKSAALREQKSRVVEIVATAFNIEISDRASVLYELDNYSVILPTPGATDGDSEFVVRVSSDEMIAAIQSLERDVDGDPRTGIHALPPWQSLDSFFQAQLVAGNGSMRLCVLDKLDNGEISNCELLIVNPKERLLGFYRWDQ